MRLVARLIYEIAPDRLSPEVLEDFKIVLTEYVNDLDKHANSQEAVVSFYTEDVVSFYTED